MTEDAFREAPHTSHTEHFIVNALRMADKLSVSLVYELNDAVVGHVAISPVSISDGSNGWFGLGPISVAPKHQNKGLGSELIEKALNGLKNSGASGCVLLGDPNYYSRFGFKVIPGLILSDAPLECFQALPFSSEMPQGVVIYHEAFNAQS